MEPIYRTTSAGEQSAYMRGIEARAKAALAPTVEAVERMGEAFRDLGAEWMEQGRRTIDSILEWQQQEPALRQREYPGSRPAWQRRR